MQNGEIAEHQSAAASSHPFEKKIILLLCLFAAIHVFVFSAAFPFFNNVDENGHFDLVVRYSHGQVPRGMENYSAESSAYFAVFTSCAYLGTADMFPGGKFPPPPWTLPVETARHDLAMDMAAWQAQKNNEVWQPPLYYGLQAIWWHLGQALGLKEGHLLYWLRFADILIMVAVVFLGYTAARLVFPDNLFLQMGVPSVLAFMPQSAFYSIETDALSPVCFGLLFICLLQWLGQDVPGLRLGIITGLAFAATYLTKLTNLSVLAVASLVIVFKLGQLLKAKKLSVGAPALIGFGLSAGIPSGAWMTWCRQYFGDLTGSKMEMECVGWTHKPFLQWWSHPIFTPHGFWTFLSELITTFWQGEFWWHREPMASPIPNAIYLALTIGFVLWALIAIIPGFSQITPSQHRALYLSLASITAAVAFSGFLSIIYDFHDYPGPSREHPYFSFGRHLLGALIPFMLLFIFGINLAFDRFGNIAKFSALAVFISFMLAVEIATDWPVFSNPYNWYHLP
jgi:Predicted membrane protein (DUF2142)